MHEAEKAKLEAKAEILQKKIDTEKAKGTSEKTLDDDVILSVKGLKMYFGGLRAVDDLSFDVKKGEIFGLIGPNGAGKTTVFNCITQFYKPTAGELLFTTKDGETITLTDYKVHDIVLKGIARTFQNVEVVKEVSVLDNLLIAATRNYSSSLLVQMLHLPKLKREEKIIRARADKILKYMDLYAYRDRLAWGLPYGVLKRIEIARALMCNPQLVILDEPAAGLNESETHALAEMINKIRVDFDCTVLLVEHDMGLVMSVCDHICAISFGKKLACGTPAEVQSSKEVQEAYLGVGEE
ncbi:MAG: ABC transporter ATP-binding protein [Clostridia bacterium]|nr:ABC transporter ATP-binding protein [Clostridia bacterium]